MNTVLPHADARGGPRLWEACLERGGILEDSAVFALVLPQHLGLVPAGSSKDDRLSVEEVLKAALDMP